MTVYDIPNIEHCDVSAFGSNAYRIIAHEGWYIHQADEPPGIDADGNPTKIYKTVAILSVNYDFSTVEITAEADLPENAEICGDTDNDHEVM
jgi:hypothetical protein